MGSAEYFPSTGTLLDFEGFVLKTRRDYRRTVCSHPKSLIDESEKWIECQECHERVDPIEFVVRWTRKVAKRLEQREALEARGKRLAELLAWFDRLHGTLSVEGPRVVVELPWPNRYQTTKMLRGICWSATDGYEAKLVRALEGLSKKVAAENAKAKPTSPPATSGDAGA